MKKLTILLTTTCLLGVAFTQNVRAQAYNTPPAMQGLNNTSEPSVESRALGGVTLMLKNDASLMFANPAGLQTLAGIQISVAGLQQHRLNQQTQQWFPSTNYSNFSLLMAGMTDTLTIPNINDSLYGPNRLNAGDTIWRATGPGPNWDHALNKGIPLQAFAAVPFMIGKMKAAAGIGVAEYANLNRYYMNTNTLSPDIGSLRTEVYYRPASDANQDALPVTWSQTWSDRTGSIYGYGGALSASLNERLAVGVNVMVLKGTTDDEQHVVRRGLLVMHRNFFGLYPSTYNESSVGTSDFSGQEYTVSGSYLGKFVTLGVAVKPPTTITREFNLTQIIDSTGSPVSSAVSGSDKMKLPWRGSIGIGFALRQNISLNLEYEYLPYGASQYTQNAGTTKPWLDSYAFKFGFEILPMPWLALRAGFNTMKDVYAAEGSYISNDPVSSSTYSGGIGVTFTNVRLDLAYSYGKTSYEDMWATNTNINTIGVQNLVLGITYSLQ